MKTDHQNLWSFFIIAFAWSWVFWLPEVFWGIRLYLGPFGPLVAALALTWRKSGKSGVISLLKSGLDYRFGKVWYLPIFLFMPVITGLTLLLLGVSGETLPEMPVLDKPWLIPVNFFYIFFLGGPLEEEFGWRGYALPRLQHRFSAFGASVILGVMWALWHLPLNFMSVTAGPQYQAAISMIVGSMITMIFLSVLFTWIYNNTNGSILAVLLFHTMINLSTFVVNPVFETQRGPLYYSVLITLLAVAVLFIYGPKKLARNR